MFTITSYNMRGSGAGKFEYILKASENDDIVFLQEHWLFEKQLYKIEYNLPNF
jgi:hypothetical protein